MIVSHKYKFVYIKNKKVAGTSIEIALSKFCGPKDILTKLTPKEDEEKRKKLGYTSRQNDKNGKYYNHMPAKGVRKIIGNDKWNEYYKFCHVRNPWDRMVSKYLFRRWKYTRMNWDFKDFIKHKVERVDLGVARQKSYKRITESNKFILDDFYKFENMTETLKDIKEKIGFSENIILPETKTKTRGKDRIHYSHYYDDYCIEAVRNTFKWEIEKFGYEFEDKRG